MEPIGFVLESPSAATGLAVIGHDQEIRAGTFVRVIASRGTDLLASVRGVRWGGGVFTAETASFHMQHIAEIPGRRDATWQLLELQFIGSIRDGRIIDRHPRGFPAGLLVSPVAAEELASYLGLDSSRGLRLGSHSNYPELIMSIDWSELVSGHIAVVGQTGSGKTNVLQLIQSRLGAGRDVTGGYVLFDFHDQFIPSNNSDIVIEPPFSFGAGDLRIDVLKELLPGVSVAQEDILESVLDGRPGSLDDVMMALPAASGAEVSKRVVLRRLERLKRSGAFDQERDVGDRVAQATVHKQGGVILRLGTVQGEIAYAFIASVVRRLVRDRMTERIPRLLLIVDEAHRLMSAQSSTVATRGFRFVAQEGRKFGVTMALATQRPSLIDSTIMSQCATMVALRLTSPEDARAVSQVMPEVKASDLGTLGVGQGLISRASSTDVWWVDFDLYKGRPSRGSSRRSREDGGRRLQQELFDD